MALTPIESYTNLFTNPNCKGDGTWAEVGRNLFTNPRLVGSGVWATVAENLFTNPRLVGSGTWAEVRRNLVKTPNVSTSNVGWGTSSSITSAPVTGGRQYTTVAVTPSGHNGIYRNAGVDAASPGDVVSGSVTIENTSTTELTFSLGVWGSNGSTNLDQVNGGYTTIAAGETATLALNGVTLADTATTSVRLIVRGGSASMPSGSSYIIKDGVTVEKAAMVGSEFSGSNTNGSIDPDMRQRWVGAGNNSESVMEIERVRNAPVPNYWRGVYGVSSGGRTRFISVYNAEPTTTMLNAIGRIANVTPGAIYTLRAKITNNTGATRSRIRAGLRSSSATGQYVEVSPPMLNGETREVTLQLPAPVDAAPWADLLFGVENQVPYLSELVIEDIGLFAGSYDGPAFSGDTTPEDVVGQITQPEDFQWRWAGAPNASESVMEIERVAGLAGNNLIAGVSTRDDKPAVRLIASSNSSNNSYLAMAVPVSARPIGVTALGTLHLDSPIAGGLHAWSHQIVVGEPVRVSSKPNNEAGDFSLVSKQLSPFTTGYFVRWYHGGTQGSGDVWWTDIGLFAGDYRYPWNGSPDDLSGITQPEDFRTRWTGAEDNSELVLEIERVRGLTPFRCIAGVSSLNGKPALRLIATSIYVADSDAWSYARLDIPVAARSGGTLIGKRTLRTSLPEFSNGFTGLDARSPIQTLTSGPGAVDELERRLKFGALTSGYIASIGHGGSAGSGDVWWTDIGLFEGHVDVQAFAGGEPFWYRGETVYPIWNGEADNSTSTFHWYNLESYQTPEIWNLPGTKFYEAGVDRVVLYPRDVDGVAWSGVTSINESPAGGDPQPIYVEGRKVSNRLDLEEFEATIEAYTAPTEFGKCDGTAELYSGLFITQQPREKFDLSYRTRIGNDADGLEHGYKLHLIYNALAEPSDVENRTLSASVDPTTFSWHLTTIPERAAGAKPSAHLVIDSRKTTYFHLVSIETILYGTEFEPPRMPTVEEVIDIFAS